MTSSCHIRGLVVTPSLVGGPFFERCIESVAANWPGAKHVVVTPNPEELSAACAPRGVTVIKETPGTKGMYGAINVGIDSGGSDWEWFTYINDDDELSPGFSKALEACHLGGDILYGRVSIVDEKDQLIGLIPTCPFPRANRYVWTAGKSALMQQGMLVKREAVLALKGFDSRLRFAGDMDFFCRAELMGLRFRYVPAVVGAFRVRSGQLSAQKDRLRDEEEATRLMLGPKRGRVSWALASALMGITNLESYARHLMRFGIKRRSEMYS